MDIGYSLTQVPTNVSWCILIHQYGHSLSVQATFRPKEQPQDVRGVVQLDAYRGEEN